MKKLLLIYLLVSVGLLTSCDYHKRECVAKATRCLTDESYKDYLSADKDSLVDSVYSLLREQRQMLLEIKNASLSKPAQERAKIAQIIEKNLYADVVRNDESAEATAVESSKTEIGPSEENGWREKLIKGGSYAGAAALGAFAASKLSCPRASIVVEYQLMQACLNSCGSDMIQKCGDGIMQWLCKDKEKVETIMNRVLHSCAVR